jgi:NADH:ubiquinone oxidoreductase subunit 3 (subunit A)
LFFALLVQIFVVQTLLLLTIAVVFVLLPRSQEESAADQREAGAPDAENMCDRLRKKSV